MSEEGQTNFQIVSQQDVPFYDNDITVVQVQIAGKQELYFSVRQLCNQLGVTYQGQIRRINDDPVLSRHLKRVNIMFTPSQGRGGGVQETNCLPVDYLNGWLFGINVKRVREDIRERLIIYQEQCYRALSEAFREGTLIADRDIEQLLQTGSSDAAQAYRMLQALVKLARNQVVMEARLDSHDARIESHTIHIGTLSQRITEIEETLGSPERQITPEQAMQISQAVKVIAIELGKRSGRNEYGGVYGELYRRYSINSYKTLPSSKFDDALTWLNQWLQNINDTSTPF